MITHRSKLRRAVTTYGTNVDCRCDKTGKMLAYLT